MKEPRSSKLSAELYRQLTDDPDLVHYLILRVRQVDADVERQLEAAGLQVRTRTTLVPMFAVRGTGRALLTVVDEPWLISVETDHPVQMH